MNNNRETGSYTMPFITITTLFFMWGFLTCMNDVLIPHLKQLFQLNYLQSMLVQFVFFGAYFIGSVVYFVISYFKGDPINRIGYKNGMLLGLVVASIGCFLFFPAAKYAAYGLFLSALFILGLGFTLLQIAANPYVSLLGKPEGASSRLNLSQAFNSLGTTIAPIVGGFLIFEFFAVNGEITAEATEIPYVIFTGIFLLLAALLYKIKLPDFRSEDAAEKSLGALKFPQLKLGIFAIFFYVGGEVCIGSFIINFLEHKDIMGLSEAVSKNYLALYWGGAMIGRFLGAISLNQNIVGPKKALLMVGTAIAVFLLIFAVVDLSFDQISVFLILIGVNLIGFFIGKAAPARTLSFFAMICVALIMITIFSSGATAMWAILGVGLFNSIMWSNIFTLSIHGLGKYTSQGSSLLVMAILGGALLPLIQGAAADAIGIQKSFFVPVICYLYIVFFGFYCSAKLGAVQNATVAGGH
ncbi:sugar MFS transporter [Pedobacter nyackensis]|uniref:sugar MFS transporter n=1 Tax=Pedobacter nyackensis TaxID=475255 RepID=UPI0029314134|nr:sugar MFS transporter [Pedobacter nyackensis]